jgi:hypothetical protein
VQDLASRAWNSINYNKNRKRNIVEFKSLIFSLTSAIDFQYNYYKGAISGKEELL